MGNTTQRERWADAFFFSFLWWRFLILIVFQVKCHNDSDSLSLLFLLYLSFLLFFACCHAVTEIHGRTFGVWTLLTCTLCFLCAFNLDNKPLYLATLLSFIYAFGHFLTEYLIYQTMAIGNLTTVGIFAGTSIVWMLIQWNAHQKSHTKHS
uniref:Ergosterol biosynthetic protein 28 n=1 Tax=Manihot esculenta TaxID=3983 RepID=A0A2C9U165_MANES